MATRVANARKNAKKRMKVTADKIENLTKGMFSFLYKREDGSWNIMKIAKDSGVCRNSVYTHLGLKNRETQEIR